MNEAAPEWLTAAECASRTGLTVRALRVYENYGLITPGRSAAGSRRYGAQELLKLNEIGLLKVLGTDEADFALPKFDLVLCFEQIEGGAAKRLVIWQCGTALRLARVDAETAKVIKQTIADRTKDRVPAPGSQAALRQMLDAGRAGNPNYAQMIPEFAQVARRQLPYWQIVGRYFGAIVSIEFLRVSNQGWDIYQVQHENDVHQYRIAIGNDGKVYGFSEASATADKRAVA